MLACVLSFRCLDLGVGEEVNMATIRTDEHHDLPEEKVKGHKGFEGSLHERAATVEGITLAMMANQGFAGDLDGFASAHVCFLSKR
jgi:hypothetical protein